jgi:DNA polymerase-4
MKAADLMGGSVTLKLKTGNFRQVTRSRKLGAPTQAADAIFQAVMPLLEREATGPAYRLIGVGCADLTPVHRADPPDLLDPERMRYSQNEIQVESALDAVRTKPGDAAVVKSHNFSPSPMLPGFDPPVRRKRRK